jgi:uncharacterized metal-binding protein
VNIECVDFDHLATDHAALFKLYKSDEITAVELSSEMLAQAAESGNRVLSNGVKVRCQSKTPVFYSGTLL